MQREVAGLLQWPAVLAGGERHATFRMWETTWTKREVRQLIRLMWITTIGELQVLRNELWFDTLAGWGSPGAVLRTIRTFGREALESAYVLADTPPRQSYSGKLDSIGAREPNPTYGWELRLMMWTAVAAKGDPNLPLHEGHVHPAIGDTWGTWTRQRERDVRAALRGAHPFEQLTSAGERASIARHVADAHVGKAQRRRDDRKAHEREWDSSQ